SLSLWPVSRPCQSHGPKDSLLGAYGRSAVGGFGWETCAEQWRNTTSKKSQKSAATRETNDVYRCYIVRRPFSAHPLFDNSVDRPFGATGPSLLIPGSWSLAPSRAFRFPTSQREAHGDGGKIASREDLRTCTNEREPTSLQKSEKGSAGSNSLRPTSPSFPLLSFVQ